VEGLISSVPIILSLIRILKSMGLLSLFYCSKGDFHLLQIAIEQSV